MNLEKLKTITLTILVTLSLVLTYFLWTFQPNYEHLPNVETVEKVTLAEERPLSEIFVPIQLFLHTEDGHQGTYNQERIAPFYELLLDGTFVNFATYTLNNQLNDIVNGNRSIEFIYADGISMEVFHQLFDFNREKPMMSHIERIVVFERESNNRLKTFAWFISTQHNSYIEAEIQNQTFQSYVDLFEHSDGFLNVESLNIGSPRNPIYFPNEQIQAHKRQAYPVPISELEISRALFPDPSLVRESHYEDDVRSYTDGNRELKLYLHANYLTFINPTRRGEQVSIQEETPILQVHRFINNHGGFTEPYVFTNANEQPDNKTRVDFRLLFNGYPAFDARIARMTVIWQEREVFEYERSTETISDSVTITEPEQVTLLSSEQLVRVLQRSSFFNEAEIENVTLGYTVSKYDDHFVFSPNWYVKHNGQWDVVSDELNE